MTHRYWPNGLVESFSPPETSLSYNLEVSARRYPDKSAIIYYGATVTYARLAREVDALAGYLQRRCGVQRGDRVALYMQNSPQYIIGYYGILRASAVVVPVSPMCLTEELRCILQDSGSRIALLGQELLGNAQPLVGNELRQVVVATYSDYAATESALRVPDAVRAPRLPIQGIATPWHEVISQSLKPSILEVGPDDLAVIPYTSGTTGQPRGCMHTHRSAMHTTIAQAEWCSMPRDSVFLAAMPMFHVIGMQFGMNTPIYLGGTSVLMTRWDKQMAAELISRYKVSAWAAVSTMVTDFLSQMDLGRFDLSSLRLLAGGGAALPTAVAGEVESRFGWKYLEGYGLSETIGACHLNPPLRPKPQCLGIPMQGVTAVVVDPDTLAQVATGAVGEILVSGAQVFRGYWGKPEITEEALVEVDGKRFLRTGDLGYVDDEGYFFMVDRIKRMINAAGHKVWPAQVETLLYEHPAVQDACVIATRDQRRGESVKAVVVLRAGCSLSSEELIEWARGRMAAYKVPQMVEYVDALPKTASGKPFWRALQAREFSQPGSS